MIRLKRVELKDGTVYKNLYYSSDWYDLEYTIEDEEAENVLFHQKKDNKYEDLILETTNIKDILMDEDFEEKDICIDENGVLVKDEMGDLKDILSDAGFECVTTFKIPLKGDYDDKEAVSIIETFDQISTITEDIVKDTFEDMELEQYTQEQVDMIKAAVLCICENEMLYREELDQDTVMANSVKATMMIVMFLLDKIGEQGQVEILDLDRTSFFLEFANYIKNESKISLTGSSYKDKDETETE